MPQYSNDREKQVKKIINFVFISYVIVGTACSPRGAESIPIETLTVTPIVEISAMNPNFAKIPLQLINIYSLDDHNNIYLLDIHDHRILKYDQKGGFQVQIGRIGQEKEGFISPVGFCVSNGLLYVLNEGGREIKIFSTNGEYRSSFRVDNAWLSNSICVVGDLIYVNVIEKKQPTENKGCLISVYSKDGRLVRMMGEIVKCNSLVGYSVFNQIIMATADSRLFWAFVNIPLIGREDLKKINGYDFFDLKELKLPEIAAKIKRTKVKGLDTPETIKPDTELKITYINYCAGFGIDRKIRMYYVIQEYPEGPGQGGIKCHLLVIGKSGKIEKKLILQHEGGNLIVSHLLFGPGDSRYGLGKIKGKILLFKF